MIYLLRDEQLWLLYALYFSLFLWNPHEFGFSFDRLLHFCAFFDWIFLGVYMSFRVDIGILRMWIFSSMHFDSSIHILISLGRFMRRFVRWIGYGGTNSRRVMDGVFGNVPLLILI